VGCSVVGSVNGDRVDLVGQESGTGPGTPGKGPRGGTSAGNGGGGADTGERLGPGGRRCLPLPGKSCGWGSRPGTGATEPRAPVRIVLSDIASFRPAPGVQHMEPDGWTVAGLDTNFYAVAVRQLVEGTLLGRPATVRFTPVGYAWDYGDGTAATLRTPGASWAALGLGEFDPTATSHIYRAVGEYTIRLRISFAPEYRYAEGPFIPIPGTVTLPANDLRITVGTAKTVLVDRDCARDPRGPGC